MMIRDAAITDQVPKLSRAEFEAFSGRLVYNMGHACFEYMEARYGKEGVRQFLYTLRKGILGGNLEDIYMQAFRSTPEEFDAGFDKWLKERFKPYRDKQRPDDYGKDLSPNQEKTRFAQVYGFSPEPLRRDGGGPHREPCRRRGRHRPALDQGRLGDPEPHERLHQSLREHLVQRQLRGRAFDRLRPAGRHGRLLRPGQQAPDPVPGVGPRRKDPAAHPHQPRPGPGPRPSFPAARRSSLPP